MSKTSKAINLVILNQILVCYVSSFMHKSFTQILNTNNASFIYTFDSASELLHTLVRVLFLFVITKISFSVFRKTYLYASVNFILATIGFSFCYFINLDAILCVSWVVNRVCVGLISATRDYIMYREIYRSDINVPLIKVLKSCGNILTLLAIIFLAEKYIASSMCLIVASIINLQISILTMKALFADDEIRLEHSNIYDKDKKKHTPISYQSIIIIIIPIVLISMNLLSDQFIYVEIGADLGFKLKFIGQTIIGLLYALTLRNNVYASASFGLIASVSYILIMSNIQSIKMIGIILYGLIYTIKNVAYLTIPRNLTKYNQIYQALAFIFESLTTFIASLFFEQILLSCFKFTKVQGHIIYAIVGIVNWFIVMAIIYKIKYKKEEIKDYKKYNQINNNSNNIDNNEK